MFEGHDNRLLFFKTMFEGHDNRLLLSIYLLVVHNQDHGLCVHVLTSVKLKVFELAKEFLHDTIDVLLEIVNFSSFAVVFQILDDLLHVVLQVDGVILLATKTGLDQPMVKDEVDSTDRI